MKRRFLIPILLGVLCCFNTSASEDVISLAGEWRMQLDPSGFGKTPGSELYKARLVDHVILPGSLNENGKGLPVKARYVDRLTRNFEYTGMAWYQKDIVIPSTWTNKEVLLHLERCHWDVTVYLDQKLVGTDERLSTPNEFRLTTLATPGKHTLTICVNNQLKYPMDHWTHGTTEYTQTNWNGMIGELSLIAKPLSYIQHVRVFPDIDKKELKAEVNFCTPQKKAMKGMLAYQIVDAKNKVIAEGQEEIEANATINSQKMLTISMGKKIHLWDEFNPYLYRLKVDFKMNGETETKEIAFGMRKVSQGKHHVRINDRDVHLRGSLECCVFPLTGYPSTKLEDWERIFRITKAYGLNHIRFHSWCPPEVAFTAADKIGVYLQAELPMWIKDVGKYPLRRDFFEKEMYAILKAYGNHPSFILMCNGNENEGDFDVLEDLVKKAQAFDNRRLYSASTARTHVKSDQYYVSHVSSKGWITVYNGKPSTDWDLNKNSDIDVPVIAHETGQRCMFPNFDEMSKYKGVLKPHNMEVFRERLTDNGMLHQAKDFFEATGKHTILQYKQVNETCLRSDKSGGFQLLGITDFPGQGTALVGVLDAFWDSKGLVTPEKYRESCAPTVLLCRMAKRTYTNSEIFKPTIEFYNYGPKAIKHQKLKWSLETATGELLQKGAFRVKTIPCATVDSLKTLSISLKEITKPVQLVFKTKLDTVRNEWNIWVYPDNNKVELTSKKEFLVVRQWNNKAKKALKEGKKVVLVPKKMMGQKIGFTGFFWNPIMFNWQPLVVGTLIAENHPLFKAFPTKKYADWQWWNILNYASAMKLNKLDVTPLIQAVDSYERNWKRGVVFEAKVGAGNLLVLNIDMETNIEKRPAAQQLWQSLTDYVSGEQFNPKDKLPFYQLDELFDPQEKLTNKSESEAIKQLLNK